VAITGATGQLGQALLERLLGLGDPTAVPNSAQGCSDGPVAGIRLRTVSRRPLPAKLRRALGTQHTRADVRSLAAREAIEGADLVFHLAAKVWLGRQRGSRDEMRSVNVDGTLNVLAARPSCTVFASSAVVYGAWPDNPLPMDEGCELRPNAQCPYAQDKSVAERVVAQGARLWSVLRFCAVLGSHADQRVARSLAGYRLAVPEVRGCAQALQWLHEDDAVEALLRVGADLLGAGKASSQVLNVATKDWVGAPDMARLAASRVLRAPGRLVLAAAEAARWAGLSPFGADRAVLIGGPLALSPAKAAEVVSWEPRRGSEEVFTEALAAGWGQAPHNR